MHINEVYQFYKAFISRVKARTADKDFRRKNLDDLMASIRDMFDEHTSNEKVCDMIERLTIEIYSDENEAVRSEKLRAHFDWVINKNADDKRPVSFGNSTSSQSSCR